LFAFRVVKKLMNSMFPVIGVGEEKITFWKDHTEKLMDLYRYIYTRYPAAIFLSSFKKKKQNLTKL
jgi:hypothetical protein